MADGWAIVAAAAVGAVASMLGAYLKDWLEARREKRSMAREAIYLAVRVSVILEEFAGVCAEYVEDQNLFSQSKGSCGTPHSVLPDLELYPENTDWRVFETNLLSRVLSFPNELNHSKRLIAWFSEERGEPAIRECYEECGRCGYIAWELAKDIGREYGFSASETATFENNSSILKPVYDEVLRRGKEQANPERVTKAA